MYRPTAYCRTSILNSSYNKNGIGCHSGTSIKICRDAIHCVPTSAQSFSDAIIPYNNLHFFDFKINIIFAKLNSFHIFTKKNNSQATFFKKNRLYKTKR